MRLQVLWTVGHGLRTDVRGRFTPALYASDWRAAFIKGWKRR